MYLRRARHPRICRFWGTCVEEAGRQLLVTEYSDRGTLYDFFARLQDEVTHDHKVTMIQQICSGMEALTAENIIHRNLCSASVLVFGFDAKDVLLTSVKIGDFSLAVTSSFALAPGTGLSTRYLAPEMLTKGLSSEQSDVWSFGITAWEILSLGVLPFTPCVTSEDIIRHVCKGGRPCRSFAMNCPDVLWEIVASCWAEVASARPTFSELSVRLGTMQSTLRSSGEKERNFDPMKYTVYCMFKQDTNAPATLFSDAIGITQQRWSEDAA